jgi:hypothetical protein
MYMTKSTVQTSDNFSQGRPNARRLGDELAVIVALLLTPGVHAGPGAFTFRAHARKHGSW